MEASTTRTNWRVSTKQTPEFETWSLEDFPGCDLPVISGESSGESLDSGETRQTGNHGFLRFYHKIWGFPVNVPLNQSNVIRIYAEWNPMTIPWKTHLRKPSPGPKGEAQRLNEAMGSSHCVAWHEVKKGASFMVVYVVSTVQTIKYQVI
jgi:hypothetical protein